MKICDLAFDFAVAVLKALCRQIKRHITALRNLASKRPQTKPGMMLQTGIKEENNEKLYAKLCRKSYIHEKGLESWSLI